MGIRVFRACYKLAFLTIWTSILTAFYYPLYLVLPLTTWATKWRQTIKKIWGIGALRILNVSVQVQYLDSDGEQLERKVKYQGTWSDAHFCVCNHCSYLDVPILLSFLPGRFIAKHEVKGWPVIGFLTRIYGTLFINRDRLRSIPELNKKIERLFHGNQFERIWLFPEGTTTDGTEVLRYKPSLLRFIEKQHPDIPVYNSVIQYETQSNEAPAEEAVCWWREDDPFESHAWNLLKLKSINATVQLYVDPFLTDNRKRLAQQLEEKAKAVIQKKQDVGPAFFVEM